MVAAGLWRKRQRGRAAKKAWWVKTTLEPGSRVVMDDYAKAGLIGDLEALGFHLAGFGCMTCIGASGPLIDEVSRAVREGVTVVSVLSGNRNFEGRIQPEVAMNYLASPPLVIAYALAGTMDIDLATEPLGHASDGRRSSSPTCGPMPPRCTRSSRGACRLTCSPMRIATYSPATSVWRDIEVTKSDSYLWDEDSTYVRRPPYLDGVAMNRRISLISVVRGFWSSSAT